MASRRHGLLRSPEDYELTPECAARVARVRSTLPRLPSAAHKAITIMLLNLSFRSRPFHPGQAANSYVQMVALTALLGPKIRGWAMPVDAVCDGPGRKGRLNGTELKELENAEALDAALVAAGKHPTPLRCQMSSKQLSTPQLLNLHAEAQAGTAPCGMPLPSLAEVWQTAALTVAHPEGTLHWRCDGHGSQAADERSLAKVLGLLRMLNAARVRNQTTWVMNAMFHACHTHSTGGQCVPGAPRLCAEHAAPTLHAEALTRRAAHVMRGVDWLVARASRGSRCAPCASGWPQRRPYRTLAVHLHR